MSQLPKIPSPPAHYWREFRHTYMPFIVFFSVLIFAVNLWNRHVAPPSIVGEVETVRSSITATVPGELLALNVDILSQVEKGDPIAVVSIIDDDSVKAELRAEEADLMVLDERLRMNNVRILENYESLKHNLAGRRVERATDNANLQHAIIEFKRVERLVKDKTVSESEYDLAKATRDSLQDKVDELDKLIIEMEGSLKRLQPPEVVLNSTNDPIVRAIKAKQDAVIEASKPMIIKAPMSGVISAVYKRKGEKVVRGDAIVVISSMESERIIGYVRQPLNIKPKVGDMVEVRSRSFNRSSAVAKVMKVGTQLEIINPGVLPMAVQNGTIEYGLPLLIALPKGLGLMPGETVDISMASAARH